MAKRVWTPELIEKVQKIAKEKNISEGAAAESLGYSAGAYSQGKNKAKRSGVLPKRKYQKRKFKGGFTESLTFPVDEAIPAGTMVNDDVVTILVCKRSNVKKVLEGLWV